MRRSRSLTPGEVSMASLLFGEAIDYGRVRVHARRYIPFQPRNCAISPNGHLYFHGSCFLDDYSTASERDKHWFLHEMVHVWQFQLGYAVRLRGMVRIGLSYAYELAPGKALADYNMEAQGDLLADYFVLRFLGAPEAMRQKGDADRLALFETVLADFLANRASEANLPTGYGRLLVRWRRGLISPG